MEIISDLVKIVLPASLALYGVYLTITSFLNKDFEKKLTDIKLKNTEIVLPIRLQAYERMCLFLERIALNNLIVRLNNPAYSAREFQQILLSEVREEYNHNLSQQVYMSDQSWNLIKKSMEDVIIIINTAASELSLEESGLSLAKAIFERMLKYDIDPIAEAIKFVKDEIGQVM